MFLDRLWVRMRGELLTLKEELSGADLKETAENLLERIDRRLGAHTSVPDGSESRERGPGTETTGDDELEVVRRQWEELKRQHGERGSENREDKPAKPNPRELG